MTQIPPKAPRVYVSFSAEITPPTTESLLATMAMCANAQVQEVYLLLTTVGGSVMHGLNLFNVLRAMPFRLVTHNVGSVNSIGNAVFLAGSPRYACPNSTFMFHGVGFDVSQPMRFEEKFLRERLESIVADQKRIGEIIEERTTLTPEQVEVLFREATTKDVAYAVSSGIIDDVRNVEISTSDPVLSLVFQR